MHNKRIITFVLKILRFKPLQWWCSGMSLASSMVYRGQAKDHGVGIGCLSTKLLLWINSNTVYVEVRIIYPSGATCLPVDSYFSIISFNWVSDCCLTPTQQFFSYIMAVTSYFSMRWWYPSINAFTCQ